MKIEDHPQKGKKAWLTGDELGELYDEHSDDFLACAAMKLMGQCGLRTKEVLDVKPKHIKEADGDTEHYILRVPEGKGEDDGKWRETIMPKELRNYIVGFCGPYGIEDDDVLIDKTRRQLQYWVETATDALAETDEGWTHVSAHDLRRSWANQLLESGASTAAVMDMGGWSNYETFRESYETTLSHQALANEAGKLYG